jgi:hypothetical protein
LFKTYLIYYFAVPNLLLVGSDWRIKYIFWGDGSDGSVSKEWKCKRSTGNVHERRLEEIKKEELLKILFHLMTFILTIF